MTQQVRLLRHYTLLLEKEMVKIMGKITRIYKTKGMAQLMGTVVLLLLMVLLLVVLLLVLLAEREGVRSV